MSATELTNPRISYESFAIKPPVHPTYDLKGIIKLALAEDAGDRGLCLNFLQVSFQALDVLFLPDFCFCYYIIYIYALFNFCLFFFFF